MRSPSWSVCVARLGRIIRTHRFGVLGPGGYHWHWDGRKASGGMAAQGRYVIRLHGGGDAGGFVSRRVTIASPLLTTRKIERAALRQTGKPYVWGATGPGSFDCSGLTQWSYGIGGLRLPRTTYQQYRRGRPVSRDRIRPGDLVFYDTAGPGPSHVGIAVTSTTFVSATSHGVRTTSIGGAFWGAHFVGARRTGMRSIRVRRPGGIYAQLEPETPEHAPDAEVPGLEANPPAIAEVPRPAPMASISSMNPMAPPSRRATERSALK